MLFGKVMDVRLLQPEKQLPPQEVMPSDKVIDLRRLQPEKQSKPKEVMLLGKTILVIPVSFLNASSSTLVTV